MKNLSFAVITAVFFLFSIVGCGNRPYMTINGEVITVSEFNELLNKNMPPEEEMFPGMEEQVKTFTENQLIRETVIDQLKNEYNIQLTKEECDQIYNYYVLSARRYPTLEIAEELFSYLENGQNKDDILKMTQYVLLQGKIIEAMYADSYQQPTEEQLQNWYNERKETAFSVPKSYYVSQLYIEKPVEEEVTEEVVEGEIVEENADGTEEPVGVVEGVEETVEEVVKETAAEKLYKELEAELPDITSEKAFMKTAAKYMKDNPYFNKKDYKANRGFIYITDTTKDIDDLLKDVPAGGVSSIYDYQDYNAYIVFYVYAMIPEHTIELDQIQSFAKLDAGAQVNESLFRRFFEEKINGADVIYNEADRLAAEEEIILEEEEIDLPAEDAPVVNDGIDDSVMETETDNAEAADQPAAEAASSETTAE